VIDLFRPVQKRSSLANPDSWLVDFFSGGGASKSGVHVTPDTALGHSAVFACVQVRSQTLASLPLKLFRRGKKGEKVPATNHPAYGLLHSSPHPQLTSFEFREMMNGHADLRGIGYAQIVRDNAGRVRRLVPLHPDRVRPVRADTFNADGVRPLFFDVTNPGFGGTQRLSEFEVLRLPNFTLDGLTGVSPIRIARESIGLALAADEHAARMFSNGARPIGVLEHPAKLDDPGRKNLRDSWQAIHGGVSNTGKVAILEENMKYHEIGLSNQDAQLLESRKYSRTEIASLWRVPPHKIGDLERATFSNIEQQSIEFVQDCMLPLCVRWEQRLDMSLLTEDERGEYFFKFNLAGLLRGDTKSRYEAFRIGLGRAGEPGWITVADIREVEDMNPIPGTDTLFTGGQPTEKVVRASLRPIFTDTLARALRKEAKAVRAIVKRADAAAELDRFYVDHRRHLIEVLAPLAEALRELGGSQLQDPSVTAGELVTESRADLGAAPAEGDALEAKLLAWETTRAARTASRILEIA
jgi:HK97 family phage portal protein